MILVDSRIGSKELCPIIQKIGVKCEASHLEYGDACFIGNGPNGEITVGVERKTLHDMLACIEDSRYSGHQLPGMARMYGKSFLIVEGCWKPHEDGFLMEGFRGGQSWGFCQFSRRKTMYSKLRRYLFSVSLSGVIVLFSRDVYQTARDICELYQWYQKRWTDHTALLTTPDIAIPTLNGKPSLCRRWAAQLTDVGVKFSLEAEKLFRKPIDLAQSSESDWMKIKGIGATTAARIIKEIRGIK